MDIYSKISQKIKEIAGTSTGSNLLFTGKVAAVNGQTCDILLGDLSLTEVRLRAVVNNATDQFLLMPKIGSEVLVTDLSDGAKRELAVIAYSEVDEVNIKIGDVSFKIASGAIELNGTGKGGLVIASDLVTKLNRIEQAFLTHVHTGAQGPVGTPQDPTFAPITFVPTNINDVTNNNVKHG